MRISLDWLKEYVDISGLSPQMLADSLTNSGLEVESIEYCGPRFNGVRVATILKVEPHPNADKLRLVTVRLGSDTSTGASAGAHTETSPENPRVVCGAANVRPGIRVAFAMEGANVLNRKDGSLFQLGRAKIRGIESAGMICSIDELGLETQYEKTEDGIWVLDSLVRESFEGQDLKAALDLSDDAILTVAPTANRGDLMSYDGVAREVAALFDRKLLFDHSGKLPDQQLESRRALSGTDNLPSDQSIHQSFKTSPAFELPIGSTEGGMRSSYEAKEGFRIVLSSEPPEPPSERKEAAEIARAAMNTEETLCSYYGGVLMKKLQVGTSPEWMSRRLQAAGMRSINNVVDITNYVMLETGQPLHAFDWKKLNQSHKSETSEKNMEVDNASQKIVSVRRAEAGETLITLDEVERSLSPTHIVISLSGQAIALAGLIGGASTEIDPQSQSLFLEGACFSAPAIRQSAKSAGFRTEASARFERGVDPSACRVALERAADLLQQYAGAEFVDIVESPVPELPVLQIPLRLSRLERILGLTISMNDVRRILEKLGFTAQDSSTSSDTQTLQVEVPSFRQTDIQREIDLIEEVIRIHGYDKVPATLPQKMGASSVSFRARLLNTLDQSLRAQGLQEVMTTSLIGTSLLEKTGFSVDLEKLVSVVNSHSTDHTLMRQSLLPNLLEIAKFNQAQGMTDIWIYELGRTYFKRGKPPMKNPQNVKSASIKNSGVTERLHVAGLMMGSGVTAGRWRPQETHDFYRLKGLIENMLQNLGIRELQFEPQRDQSQWHPGRTAVVKALKADPSKSPSQSAQLVTLGCFGELHPYLQESLKFPQPVYLFELDVDAIHTLLNQQSAQVGLNAISPYPAVERDMAFIAPETVSHQEIMDVFRRLSQDSPESALQKIELFDEYRDARFADPQSGQARRSLAYRLIFQSKQETLTDTVVDKSLTYIKTALSSQLAVQFRE